MTQKQTSDLFYPLPVGFLLFAAELYAGRDNIAWRDDVRGFLPPLARHTASPAGNPTPGGPSCAGRPL